MKNTTLIPVEVLSVFEDPVARNPVVVLHDSETNRILPIWIGQPEARAIMIVLQKIATPRPLTHRLIFNIVEKMGGAVTKVVVSRLENQTYFATISVALPGKTLPIDARPSDAIALALEARVPLFVAKEVLDKAGQENPFPEEKKPGEFSEEELGKLKDLLEKAREREETSGEEG